MEVTAKEKCTACGLCAAVCNKRAIKLEPNEITGFLYPVVDSTVCVNCGLCQRVCTANNPIWGIRISINM